MTINLLPRRTHPIVFDLNLVERDSGSKSKAPTHTQHYDRQIEHKGYDYDYEYYSRYGIDDQYFRLYNHGQQMLTNEASSSSNTMPVFKSYESDASTSWPHIRVREQCRRKCESSSCDTNTHS